MNIKSMSQDILTRSRLLFTLRQHLATIPAILTGASGGARQSWSQHGEDTIIVKELKPYIANGFYVDVGANHPAKLSNTYRLYCMGMRGICIEPNDIFCRMHTRYRPGDIVLCTAIGPEPGLSKFYEMSYHALSTFSEKECYRLKEQGMKIIRETFKPIFPLDMIIERCRPLRGDVFALLSIDTEGWDDIVLRSNDWERFRPRMVVVEHNSEDATEAVGCLLAGVGYTSVGTYGCNSLFTDDRMDL